MSHRSVEIFLSDQEAELEQQIAFAISLFQTMNPETLLMRPKPGSWNTAECLEHLNSYGAYYLPLLHHQLTHGTRSKPNEKLNRSLTGRLLTALAENGKLKMKAHERHLPSGESLDPHAVVSEHLHQQEKLITTLRELKHISLSRNRIPVSVMPMLKLNLGEIVRFLIVHNARHLNQAALIHGLNFPDQTSTSSSKMASTSV